MICLSVAGFPWESAYITNLYDMHLAFAWTTPLMCMTHFSVVSQGQGSLELSRAALVTIGLNFPQIMLRICHLLTILCASVLSKAEIR